MATVTPTINRDIGSGDGSVIEFAWTLTSTNTDGAYIEIPEWADITWLARGTWGGATLKFQGSDDGTNVVATGLSNAAGGTEATASGDKVITTIERPRFVRPNLTTAGSGASITVKALVRRTNTLRT